MKLEIDIDEDYYKIICKKVQDNKPFHSPYEYEVIADGKLLEQEPILDKIRAEIAEYGSIWVEYAITGHSDRDIENLIESVLKQAKEQVLDVIDKNKAESEK